MVNSDESPMHLAKLLGLRTSPISGSDRHGWKYALEILKAQEPYSCISESVMLFKSNVRRATLLKLLSVQNFELDRNLESITQMMIPALELLLDFESNVEVLDLTGLISYCPNNLRYTLLKLAISHVSQRTTNLLSLSILKEGCVRYIMPTMDVINEQFIEAFGKMEHLQMLRIEELYINLNDLMRVCRTLLNLRFISVNISEKDFNMPTSEELRVHLQLLKAFFFRSNVPIEQHLEFTNMCRMHLSNLQIVEDFASVFCTQIQFRYAPHMEQVRNLRHLWLDLHYEQIVEDVHLMFPHVTHLRIEGSDSSTAWQVKPLLQFSEIESLHLRHVPPEEIAFAAMNCHWTEFSSSAQTLKGSALLTSKVLSFQ
ncbi:Hypothetical predicted protein [Cloeon dipterum]|uniref:Uncharacterized protein n=1 Tax=Cloeon dipterum TaxID=197152 RepID=A0A8S1CUJ8_9INSE|nr:Hypothetical predicted protein [Cloeon dipterum]